MTHQFADIAFTPNVQRLQEQHGSRAQYARLAQNSGPHDALGPDEAAFLERADSFYLATVSETGWPYVQHAAPGRSSRCSRRRGSASPIRGNMHVSTGSARQRPRLADLRRLRAPAPAPLPSLRFVALADAVRKWSSGRAVRPGRARRARRRAMTELPPTHHATLHGRRIDAATQPLRDRIAELEARLAAARPPA